MDTEISTLENNPDVQNNITKNEDDRIFRLAPIALLEIDQDGTIINYNNSAKKLFSKISKDPTELNLLHLENRESKLKLSEYFNQIKNSTSENVIQVDVKYEIEEGKVVTFLYKFSHYFPEDNSELKIVAAVEDISSKKEEEQYIRRYFEEMQVVRDDLEERTSELALLNEKLRQSEMQLEEINKNKDRFFSIISHDLRSPFNSLLGLTKLILEDFDGFSREEIKDSLYNLHQVSEGLFNLIEDLLDWSRIQFNRIEFEPKVFNLYEVVSSVVNALRSVAKDKNITVVNLVPKNCTINADAHMIKTIIRNLVNNAIKFTPKYGLIKISSGFDIDDLIVSVEDTGIGMSKEIVNKLFKLDSKVTSSGTEGETGTGLGLLISKEFVEKHNGKIWAKSEREKGSTFFFRIPVEPEEI